MTDDELLIHELAERAGISVRTIRYYIEEGLLPQPSYQGKYSYYTIRYLDRLELIRRLKESYLPLKEIRAIMNSLSDREVRMKLKDQSMSSPRFSAQVRAAQPPAKPGAKALEYIDQVMEDQTKYRKTGTFDKPVQPTRQIPTMLYQTDVTQPEKISTPSDIEDWQRISFAPGVELHLRRPLDHEIESRVRQVIIFAKRIFRSKL